MDTQNNNSSTRFPIIVIWGFVLILISFVLYLVISHLYFGYEVKTSYSKTGTVMSAEDFVTYNLNKNIFRYLSYFGPIILALFSGIFGFFTYMVRQNISESENLLKKSENLLYNMNERQNDLNSKIELVSNKFKAIHEDAINAGIKRTEINRQLFMLYNTILDDKYKVKFEESIYLTELMDTRTVIKACYYLNEQGSVNSIPFMLEYYKLYNLNEATKQYADLIINTINTIKERNQK